MQIAQERVHLLTSLDNMRSHAGACSKALYLHKPIVRKALLFAVSSAAAIVSFKLFRRRDKAVASLSPQVGIMRFLIAKLALDVMIPWMRKSLDITEPKPARKRGFFHRLINRSK